MSYDNRCPICNKSMIKISRSNFLSLETGWSWENDSTMALINADSVTCDLKICLHCLHLTLFPKFDTSLLYTSEGPKVRKKYFETYNRGINYEAVSQIQKNIFYSMSNEMFRYFKQASLIYKSLKSFSFSESQITIIDYGGGDGYVGDLFSKTLERLTGIKTTFFVYDPIINDVKNSSNQVNKNQLDSIKGDIVILSHTLEHVHNPNSLLAELYNRTKENGLVLVEVPNEKELFVKALTGGKFGLNYHVNYYSKRSLVIALIKAGYCNVSSYDIRSSYHGTKLNSVFAIGQKKSVNSSGSNRVPSIPYEILTSVVPVTEKCMKYLTQKIFRM